MALTDRIGNILTVFIDLMQYMRADTVFFQESGGSRCCLNIEAQVIESLDQRQTFRFILICDGHKDRSIVLHMGAACLQCFIECTVQLVIIADRFTGGFHLR